MIKPNHFYLSVLPLILLVVLITAILWLLSGCYTIKQGTTMLGYLRTAVPLDKLTAVGGDYNDFIELVEDIRYFALK